MRLSTLLTTLAVAAPLAVVIGGPPASANDDAPRMLVAAATGMTTSDFVQKVAISDMFEVESSKLALERSKDPGVRAFAQEMVRDHTMSTNKLKETIKSAHVDAAPPSSLDDTHQKLLSQLQKSSDFDRDYMKIQMQGHENALKLLQDYSQGGDNDALKKAATQTIPMVKKHLAAAEKIAQPASKT